MALKIQSTRICHQKGADQLGGKENGIPESKMFMCLQDYLWVGKLSGGQGAHQFEHILVFKNIHNLLYFFINPTTFSALQLGFQCSFATSETKQISYYKLSGAFSSSLSLEINHLSSDLSVSQCDWCGLLLTHPSACSVPGTVLAVHLCEPGQERVFEPTDVWIRTSTDTLETQATRFTLPQMTMLTGS